MKSTDCLPRLRLSSRDQPTSNYWKYFTDIPGGICTREILFGHNTLSCCSRMSLDYAERRNVSGIVRVQTYWNLFLAPLPFARLKIQSLSAHCEAPSQLLLFLCCIFQHSLRNWLLCLFPEEYSDHVAIWSLLLTWRSTHDHNFPNWRPPTFFRVEERRRVSALLLISFEVLLQ